ncbi:MAG: long-chain-acyl-CoA synthetase [Halieaceae bacterium]|nr:long-chain-acyl-CoA synthetase [Halieaceae bacterium]
MSIRDVVATLAEAPTLLRISKGIKPRSPDSTDCFAARLESTASRLPDNTAVIFEGRTVTWRELNASSNRIASSLKDRGIEHGDTVSLVMENRIEFLTVLIALNKLGAIAALINTNLSGQALSHCITITDSRMCIFGEERLQPIEGVHGLPELAEIECWLFVSDKGELHPPAWSERLDDTSGDDSNPAQTGRNTIDDTALYIFTSGTTGLPKASIISNRRFLTASALSYLGGIQCTENDCIYLCLPLYHGTGLFLGVGAAFATGASMFIRRKFSASRFIEETRTHNTTCFVYIGELCRYLMNIEPQADDHTCAVSKMMGNGLRPDVWHQFKSRFGIKRVAEFYGSSEGNVAFVNMLNKDCTVGTTTIPLALVGYDVEEDELQRNDAGNLIKVKDGDPGLLLGKITPSTVFEGYTSKDATEKKILRDVFEKGDTWFNTGDLMRTVDVGFAFGLKHYQFVDRVGDTFRWKSENVSTNEVGEIINAHAQIDFCNVYGVEIPKADGKAGMAALVLAEGESSLDIDAFSAHVKEHLPAYARPVFLRIQREMDTTGTFKMVKGELRKDGYDLSKISDPIYVLKPRGDGYESLNADYAAIIKAGEAGF